MESKVCVICITETSIHNFTNKNRESKPCNIQRSLKLYYDNEDKLSNQFVWQEMCYLQSVN